MNKSFLSGLALLLAGCPKTQKTVEDPIATPSSSSSIEYSSAQTIAQFLILDGDRRESLYVFDIETDYGTMTVAYSPVGKTGDFADDILYLLVPPEPQTLYGDVGVDGTLDFISDMRESTPILPFSFLPDEEQAEQASVYTTLLQVLVTNIKIVYNVKKLKRVKPQ